ncbi:MAG: formylglycine-generating enzyme family protein [Fibrobacter sp.]|nr:formylglycine-generating enzyme family protein [Fibrobacter sp.]
MKKGAAIRNLFVGVWAILFFVACSSIADGDAVEIDTPSSSSRAKSSSSAFSSSSGTEDYESVCLDVERRDSLASVCETEPDTTLAFCDSLVIFDSLKVLCDSLALLDSIARADSLNNIDPVAKLDSLIGLVVIPGTTLKRGSASFSVDSFAISKFEVTQGLYEKVMGEIPLMDKIGDSIAVANVNWFDAVLFCNALSILAGLDTAYVYEGVGDSRYLKNLSVDFKVRAVRLPTETEWEIAYRAGTTTTYYWDTDVASKYAYYIQTNGPVKVAQYKPNAYGLYDMGGNVAEWMNDWYGTYPTTSSLNYTGAVDGDYRVVRGGGWSDKASALAAAERNKKDPLYQSQMVGFRVVRSNGF